VTDEAPPATTAWRGLLNGLLTYGDEVNPRDMPTRELLGVTTKVDMRWPIVAVAQRKLGLRFMAAEAAWILSGDNRVETIRPYSKEIERFSDDGVWFAGAYGPPLRDQLGYLVSTLARDPLSRQAVATIWRPRPGSSKDVPCTVSAQLLLRPGTGETLRVHVIVNMRSSDAWLGWPYDVFNFTCLGYYVAAHLMRRTSLNIYPGTLTLNAGSQHLYERNVGGARACLYDPDLANAAYKTDVLDLRELKGDPEELISHLWWLANTTSREWSTSNFDCQPRLTWLLKIFHDRYHREES
jgi:thymidylate synthase